MTSRLVRKALRADKALAGRERDGRANRARLEADVAAPLALAEVLQCQIVSIDGSRLFDRVPVFTAASDQSVTLRSWKDDLAPMLKRSKGVADASDTDTGPPFVVIVNNGLMGPGGHFDATVRV